MTVTPGSHERVSRAVELAFAAILLVGSGAFIWLTTLIPDPPRNVSIGPRSFPYAVGVIMLVLSAVLVWRAARSRGPSGSPEAAVVPLEDDQDAISDWPAVWVVLGSLLLLFVLLEPLGFIPAMTIFVFGLSTFFSPSRWILNLVVSLCFSGLFYGLFTAVLGIPLPTGILSSLFS
jgi:putative tricarboxylic transport membrane protein